jgi:hypothetical protein
MGWLRWGGFVCGVMMGIAVLVGEARFGGAQEVQLGSSPEDAVSASGVQASEWVTTSTVGWVRVESIREVVLQWRGALQLSDRARQAWGVWSRSRSGRKEASLLHPGPATGWEWEEVETHAGPGWIFGFLDAKGRVQCVSWLEFESSAMQEAFRERWMVLRGGETEFKSWVSGGLAGVGEGRVVKGWEGAEQGRGALAVIGDGIVLCHSGEVLRAWLESVESNRVTSKGVDESGAGAADPVEKEFDVEEWGQQSEGSPIRFWCSPQRWMERQEIGEGEPLQGGVFGKGTRASRWLATAKLWEVVALRSIGGSVHWDAAEREWVVTYRGEFREPLSGAWRLLELQSRAWTGIPPWVRRDADGWSLAWIDRQPWFEGVRSAMDRIIDPTQPGIFDDVLDSLLTDPDGPKINIRRELIDHLGPQVLHAQRHVTQADDEVDAQSMWVIELQDAPSATQVFERFFDGDDAVKREEQGAGILWIAEPGESILFAFGSEDEGVYHCMGIRGSAWWIANDIAWLREAWRESDALQENTKSDEEVAGASVVWSWERGGGEGESQRSALVQVEDWSRSLESAWKAAERGLPEAMLQGSGVGIGAGATQLRWLQDWVLGQSVDGGMFDSRLPDWEDVRGSLGVWSHRLQRDVGGVQGELRWRRAAGK